MVVVDRFKYSAFSTMNPRKYRCSDFMRIAWEGDFGTKNCMAGNLFQQVEKIAKNDNPH
jgi:hypothetical protein